MPVSFAGIPIGGKPDLDSELQGLLDTWWHLHGIEEWEYPGYFARDLGHLGIPDRPRQKAPELNVLTCPSGCSRFGTYHALVTGDQLSAINAVLLQASTDGYASAELLLDDGAGGGFYTPMWLLPPRPVFQKGSDELYLLTLADWRWLNLYRLPGFGSWAPGDSWATAINALMGAVAPSYFVSPFPTVAADYGVPSDRWPNDIGADPTAAPLAPMADAAFESVGLRYCYVPVNGSGTFGGFPVGPSMILRTADSAKTLADSQWETWKNEVLCGGRLSVADAIRSIPRASYWYTYDRWAYGVDNDPWPSGDEFKSVNVNGGSLTIDLALTDYAVPSGLPIGYGGLQMVADLSGAAGSVALAAYVTQAAIDFYKWALSRVDATFRGLIPWQTTGFEDRIEWRVRDDGYTTTVYRRPFGDLNRYGTDLRIPASHVLPTKAATVGTKTLKTIPGGPPAWA